MARHLVDAFRADGLDVRKVGEPIQIPFDDGSFDIVYLMQVFEHLRDPHDFMRELSRVLKQDGMLYLALPNAASVWRRVFGRNWLSGWFAPFHLYCYNRGALAALAGQHGFEVVDTWTSTPVSWFRLNLKACFYRNEAVLDRRQTWLDTLAVQFPLMTFLRIAELPLRERDCLVMSLRRKR
jgi:SAM-dependent methyltransferase